MTSQNPTQKSPVQTLRVKLADGRDAALRSLKAASDSARRNIEHLPPMSPASADPKVLGTIHRAIVKNETSKFARQLREADPAQRLHAIVDALNYVAAVGGTSFESLNETLAPPAHVKTPEAQAKWKVSQFASRMLHLSQIASQIQTYDRNASDAIRAVIHDRTAKDLESLANEVLPHCIDNKSVTAMFDNIRKCVKLPLDAHTSYNLRVILDPVLFDDAVTHVADLSDASDHEVAPRVKVVFAIIHQSNLAAGTGSLLPRNVVLMNEALADDIAKGIAHMSDPALQRDAVELTMSNTTTRGAYREAFAKVGVEVPSNRQLAHSAHAIGLNTATR